MSRKPNLGDNSFASSRRSFLKAALMAGVGGAAVMGMSSILPARALAADGAPGTIIEAFKPGTGPADSYWVIGMGEDGSNGYGAELSPSANQAIQSGGGGLY